MVKNVFETSYIIVLIIFRLKFYRLFTFNSFHIPPSLPLLFNVFIDYTLANLHKLKR